MNYIGSKLSLKSFIKDTILGISKINSENKVFADLFAGTGVIGSEFKKMGYKVIANDIQHYSYILNKHFIENNSPMNIELIEHLNSLEGKEGFIYNNYCMGSGSERNYFSDFNGKKCDAIRQELEKLYKNKEIDEHQYNYFLASLINSIDKHANTASVYGAFLKSLKKSAVKDFELELLPIIDGNKDGKVYNEDINILIKEIKGDILYLDPPYNARQYSANYHLLETISKYDNPIIKGKTGLRDYSNQKSKFCSKSQVNQVFEELISDADFKYIFLSYNDEGLMSLETIKKIMEKYGEYKCFTTDYKRFRADKEENRNHKKSSTVEYLHCLIKN
ncbi:modification methylase [Fusobacterium nucleatum YWH7199]|uniref:site-specific DNA-methyltransferase (adenine-specific) n=1 Tax=Fusobacterium nucleatum TaxID=851 RepID=A0A133PB11_FUSNU|nr:DNA adenine methylase [Fusobacterium nucleatum]KXA25767.1 modification methylase FokI domain protein [Fusobacterium nucleatum]MCL4575392.1 modification methylase [Fusobacterium nucleatum YWH7056]MCL4581681.1 modification methylase [Fusobacterium nucleatum YWH7199]MCL4583093.1 modification methylase [Fusobacterium nucleatum YWH7054]MCL4593085.1 modification methylase [Fusobacterium nucleatum YWH7053]